LKKLNAILTCLLFLFICITPVQAHSGRTDSSGGHRDNKNASGLGSYHYHHGMGPHLHPGGVCPYASGSSSNTSSGLKYSSNSSSYSSSNNIVATIPNYSIKINNTWIDNQSRKYPILSYKSITYIPLTYNVCSALGISSNWSSARGLSLTRGNKATYTEPVIEYDIFAYNLSGKNVPVTLPGNMTVNGTWFANAQQEYPFIEYRDITYMPLTWNNVYYQFGLSMTWDPTTGLSLFR